MGEKKQPVIEISGFDNYFIDYQNLQRNRASPELKI